MSGERIEMLKKALALYEFAVDQRKEYGSSKKVKLKSNDRVDLVDN